MGSLMVASKGKLRELHKPGLTARSGERLRKEIGRGRLPRVGDG